MSRLKHIYLFLGIILGSLCLFIPASAQAFKVRPIPFQKGMNLTSWGASGYPRLETEKTLRKLKANRVQWVTLIQTWNQKTLKSNNVYRGRQAVQEQNLIHTIRYARRIGLKVLLRPYVDVEGGKWRGFANPSKPREWFRSYGAFAIRYARIAQKEKAGAYVFASEMGTVSLRYPKYWRYIAYRVRQTYKGPTGYEANWNEARGARWLQSLDFIGLSAYNPICKKPTLHLPTLEEGWRQWMGEMKKIVVRNKRSIVFTEAGYRPLASSCTAPWDTFWLRGRYSQQAQAQFYLATLKTWWPVRWFKGIHWWAANPTGIRKYPEDHDPRSAALRVIKRWYGTRAAGEPRRR